MFKVPSVYVPLYFILLSGCAAVPTQDDWLKKNARYEVKSGYFEPAHMDYLFRNEREGAGRRAPPNLGLALAGGGTKASSFAMGVLQGMHSTGLMKKVDILSTVSGGGYAGYWYYSRLVLDTGDEFRAAGKYDPARLNPFFADCLPSRYVEMFEGHPLNLERCPPENFTNYEHKVPFTAPGAKDLNDPYRYQNYIRAYQDLFSTGRNMFGARSFNYDTTDEDGSINNEIVENTVLLVASAVINVIPNIVFDWQWNVSSTQRAYAKGIARTYGASPPLCQDGGCVTPLLTNGEIRREGDIRKARQLTFKDIRRTYEEKGAPMWIINTTAGEDRSVLDVGGQSDLRFTSFEFTPYGFGSGLYGYKEGELEGITPTEAVVSSAAFFDDQQKGEMSVPWRNFAAAGMKVSTLNWGSSYRNPNVEDFAYFGHMALPFPLYYVDRLKAPKNSTFIHLSDGGQSENLGAYALIRRGVPNIIISDHAEDRGGNMHDVCRLKTQIREQGLSLRLPGLEDFDEFCTEKGEPTHAYDIYNWRHPVLLGCIVESPVDGGACVEPSVEEKARGKYFARLFVIKPAIGNEGVFRSLRDISESCSKDIGLCAKALSDACTKPISDVKSPMWANAEPASCEMYGFIRKNGPGTSGIAKDDCPHFPQYGTVAMTVDSSPWMYGAMRDLAAYYTGRVGVLFDAQGGVDLNLFNAELAYQAKSPVELVRANKGSMFFTPKAGVKGQCSGFRQSIDAVAVVRSHWPSAWATASAHP